MFQGLQDFLEQLGEDVKGLIGVLLGVAIILGTLVIVGLSIVMMFSDEQSAQRYKHWRTNVIKAVVVAGVIGAVLLGIQTALTNAGYWGKTG